MTQQDFELNSEQGANPKTAAKGSGPEVTGHPQTTSHPGAAGSQTPPSHQGPGSTFEAIKSSGRKGRGGGSGAEQSAEYLTFLLDGRTYGVNIMGVQEIIGLPRLTRLPRSPKHVLGVINLRGMVVPVQDLRIRLDLPVRQNHEPVVVVAVVGQKVMGAVVDAVSDVVLIAKSAIQEPTQKAGAVSRQYLRGLYRNEDQMIILLELDKMLEPPGSNHAQ